MSIWQDVTEQRKMEEAEKERDKLQQLLLDSLPHPAMLINKDRIILASNKTAKEVGADIGEYCWRGFGHCEFISDEAKAYVDKHKKPPPGGAQCSFCLMEKAFEKKSRLMILK